MGIDVLLGLQWGDEGKGKIVDAITKNYNIVARFQGGPNAGHTIEFDGVKHVLHTIPSGIFHENTINLIGNGVVVDPIILKKELESLEKFNLDTKNKLLISRKAHIILPTHCLLDSASETLKGKTKIGSTLKGIGPTYMDKTGRNGLRIGDLELSNWKKKYTSLRNKHLEIVKSYDVDIDFDLDALEQKFFQSIDFIKSISFVNSELYIHSACDQNKKILAEGAQGSLLDIDFGTYPFVTSSNTTAAGACTGLGVSPRSVSEVLGIFKAYTTRVGSGPFPTELFDETRDRMRTIGNEFGATTGRERRCGWVDLVALKYAVRINGVTQLIMMKADVLTGFDKIKVCTAYKYQGQIIKYWPYNTDENIEPLYDEFPCWNEDLTEITVEEDFPKELSTYINFLEKELEVPIKIISVGPDRKQTIYR